MKTTIQLAALLSVFPLAGCLAIDAKLDGKYVCGEAGACPSGLTCSAIDNHCHKPGWMPDPGFINPDDMPDLSDPNNMPPDMSGGDNTVTPSVDKSTVAPRLPSALANGKSPIIVDVIVRNADGQPLSGQVVTLDVTGAGVSITQPLRTDSSGKTSGQIVSLKDEDKTVTATAGTVKLKTALVTFATVTPASVDFINSPHSAGPGSVINPPVQVRALDADGYAYSGPAANATMTITGGDASAVLGGGGPTLLVDGVATFKNLTVDKAGVDYQLLAHVGTLQSPPSGKFSVTSVRPGPPQGLTHAWMGPNLKLSWTAPVTGAAAVKYQVFRGTDPNAITTQIGGDIATTSVVDPTFLKSKRFYYVVYAFDASGNQGDPSTTDTIDVPRELCVADNAGSLVSISTDPNRTTALRTVTGLTSPRGVAVDLGHDEIFVAAEGSNSIFVYDRNTTALDLKANRTISGLSGPKGVALYQTTSGTLYDEIIVTNTQAGTVVAYDRTSQTAKWTITNAALNKPSAITTDPANGDIYVSNEVGNTIIVFKHDTQAIRATAGTIMHAELSFPYGLTILNSELFSTAAGNNEVLVFTPSTGAFVRKLTPISKASGIVADPSSLLLWVSTLAANVNSYAVGGTLSQNITGFSKAFGVALCN